MQRFVTLDCQLTKILMRPFLFFLGFALTIFYSCSKRNNEPSQKCSQPGPCNSTEQTTRVITNKAAKIQASGGQFYIVEYMNNIDTRLLPCNLNPDFRVDGLMVTVSGNVKETVKNTPICCTENFEITSICK
jgi:hypothetical protein